MRSSTRDTLRAQVPPGQLASEAPAAGSAWPAARTGNDLALHRVKIVLRIIAEIIREVVAEIIVRIVAGVVMAIFS